MARYDQKPAVYSSNNDGSYTYRWDVHQVEVTLENGTTKQWECREVHVWGTVTANKITEAVIAELWPGEREQKYLNEYNAAREGLLGKVDSKEAVAAVERYKTFLGERQAIKAQIDADCKELGIE